MKNIILVGIGGFLGSISRYGATLLLAKHSTQFPLSTFLVNIIGSFLIGVFYALTEEFPHLTQTRLFLSTGFCGGFTTFSAFTAENLNLLQKGEYVLFFTYVFTSILIGILAVLTGILVVKVLK